MAGESSNVIVVAQTETGHAVVGDAPDTEGTHAETVAAGHEEALGFPPFDASSFGSQLLWLAISFGALYLLMSRVALPRVGEILEVRRDRIEGDLAEADRLREKTDQAIKAYETDLAEARAKANAIADDTRQGIKAENSKARASAEAKLATKMAEAEARIAETKNAALSNVDEIAAQTAVAIVGAISGKVAIADARNAVSQVVKG